MKKMIKAAVVMGMVLSLFLTLSLNVLAFQTTPYAGASFAKPVFISVDSSTLQTQPAYFAQADFTVNTYEQLIQTVAQQYVARDTEFTVLINDAGDDLIKQLGDSEFWRDVFTYDIPGTTSDIYYLRNSMTGGVHLQYSYNSSKTFCTYTHSYYTTAEQEAYVDSAVDSILDSLALDNLNPYEKIKAVHDYIVGNVEYDYTLSKYSAYEALNSGQTVCNGYALLTYKMLSEVGVPVKITTGTAGSGSAVENHAWNVVKIGPWWYNLDVTWDDTARTTDYFLKSNASFSGHYAFEYPDTVYDENIDISPTDFDPSADFLFYDPADLSSWARDGVMALIEHGVVPVSIQSGFQDSITRAEFTALIVNVYEHTKGDYTLQDASPFTDIADSSFVEQIAKGYELGLINGISTDEFDPYGTLTREQCAKIISAAVGLINSNVISSDAPLPFGDVASIQEWALMYVRYAYENGLMNGTGANFEPQGLLTREQAMVIAERMIAKYNW